MLTYLINVTGDMLAVSLVIGIIMAFIDTNCTDRAKVIYKLGIAAGFVSAGIRAYITNTRRLEGGWKVGAYGLGISLGLFVLSMAALCIFGYSLLKHKKGSKMASAGNYVIAVTAALLSGSYLYCELPNVFAYPFKFGTDGESILSTEFLFRLGGYLLGIAVCAAAFYSAYKLCMTAAEKGMKGLLTYAFPAAGLVLGVYLFAMLMLVLTPRKIVDSPELFSFAASSSNYAYLYTCAVFLILVVTAVIFWIKSFTVKEPYSNKAQHRKQRAVWRSGRRYSVLMAVCLVTGILCATWFVALNTVEIREAPVEDPVIIKDSAGHDSTLQVPIEIVQDGHLHRFGYKTPDGNLARFIVVLKQENTNNYGVGLDACEICGEAGYYENNNGQIVCKKCNVIMNRTTIGMKGGCNPIIIDYDIDESNITVPVEEMVKNGSRFKN